MYQLHAVQRGSFASSHFSPTETKSCMYNLDAKANKPLQRVMVKSVLSESVADAAGDYPTFHLSQMHVALNISTKNYIEETGLHIFIFIN